MCSIPPSGGFVVFVYRQKGVDMMKSEKNLKIVTFSIALLLLAPGIGSAAAGLIALSDGGFIEHLYSTSGKPYVDTIQFVWLPEGPPDDTDYAVLGYCSHSDFDTGVYSRKFKAVFKQLTLEGVDSGLRVTGQKGVARTRSGLPSRFAIWDLGTVGAQLAASDSAVVVSARVVVKGRVVPQSYLQCFLRVEESAAGLFGATATSEERMETLQEIARMKLRPRPAGRAE
jgi:hypothetical protein